RFQRSLGPIPPPGCGRRTADATRALGEDREHRGGKRGVPGACRLLPDRSGGRQIFPACSAVARRFQRDRHRRSVASSGMTRVLHLIYDDPGNPWVAGGGAVRAFEIYRRLTARLGSITI